MPTHEVTNQVPPLLGFNTAETPMIDDALRRAHVDAAQLDEIHALGALGGTAEALEWGDLAEAHPPVLKTHDRYGNRVDEVVYDPAYHQLMKVPSSTACTPRRGPSRALTPTSSAPRSSACGATSTPDTAARSR
ncbi:hypothetical protein GCM10009648_35050 [Tsukamurella spumae]